MIGVKLCTKEYSVEEIYAIGGKDHQARRTCDLCYHNLGLIYHFLIQSLMASCRPFTCPYCLFARNEFRLQTAYLLELPSCLCNLLQNLQFQMEEKSILTKVLTSGHLLDIKMTA